MKIKIKITKAVLRESADCSPKKHLATGKSVGENCAFAVAVRDLLPRAAVGYTSIFPFGTGYHPDHPSTFSISHEMTEFIKKFDRSSEVERLAFNEEEFELDLPEWVVGKIGDENIEEVKRLISTSPTLELV